MASYVIWMDAKESKIFDLTTEGAKLRHLHAHGGKSKLQPYGDKNQAHHHGLDGFFKEVADSIKGAKEVVLLGPADTKLHFKSYLEKHSAHDLAKKVVAVVTVDHPTDNQILAKAREIFKEYDTFGQTRRTS